jgi:dTDP-4-dehydrorhamnose reductase
MLKILVLGANGQLGRCFADHVALLDASVWCAGRAEVDIIDEVTMRHAMQTFGPDIVINASAYTLVDEAEGNKEAAQLVNHIAVAKLAQACSDFKCWLIHFSTDYVFDGEASNPYLESCLTNPKSEYGLSKLNGELAIQQSDCQHLIIRTSWVFSEYGSNFMKTMLRVGSTSAQLSIVDDQFGCPTYAQNLAHSVVCILPRLLEPNSLSGVYHYCGRGECSWYDFAQVIFEKARLLGLKVPKHIIPTKTVAYPTPARRPKYSALNTDKFFNTFGIAPPDWKVGVDKVFSKI